MGSTFGGPSGSVFGGPGGGGGGGGTAGVALNTLIEPMLRIAGITDLPGTQSNIDKLNEAVGLINRLIGSWNLDGWKGFTSDIQGPFDLAVGQKIYTLGPGGEIDMPRPLFIKQIDVLYPTGPVLRRTLELLNDEQWQSISIQDIAGAPPYQAYYDGGYDENGLAKLYIRFQPPAGYSLEILVWRQLQSGFISPTDVAVFPPGYERALVLNGAVELADMYPREAKISPTVEGRAAQSLQAITRLNEQNPPLGCYTDGFNDDDGYGWTHGPYR